MIKLVEVSSDTNIGGAGKCLLILAKEYDRSKFDMTVIIPRNSLLKPHLEELGVKIIEMDNIADQSFNLGAISSFRRLFRKIKPDIVHTHSTFSARVGARLAGVKVVYTRHSVFEPSPRISKGIGKKINGFMNHVFSDGIIAVAEAAKDNLVATGINANRVTVILNGVYPTPQVSAEEKEKIRQEFNIPKDKKVISIVARLEDIKGHDYFIDAAKILVEKGVNAVFVIAGTGAYEQHLKDKVKKLNLTEHILFTGFITNVDQLMNITHIQVNASFGTEATSLALLEGMSLGIPAVVSDFGGNPGVISHKQNGYIVPKQNANVIADALFELLIDNELYAELSKNCISIFKDKFTAQKMTQNTEQFYQKL